MENFVIVKDTVKIIRRFNLKGRCLEFKLKSVPEGLEPVTWIKKAINQVIQKGTEGLKPSDQVAFSFCSKDFSRGDGWVRFQPVENITYDDVWKVISSVYQSNSTGLSTANFCLGITSVRMPAGKGRGKYYNNFAEECGKRRGIVVINNKDNMCLPRALVVAKANVDKDPEYTKIRKDTGKIQLKRATELCQNAGVSIPEEGGGIIELQAFQRYLLNNKIVVYKYGTKGRDVIFKGSADGPTLNLLHHKGHYNVITSLTAAFCCIYYCETCNASFDHKNKHRCCETCPGCQQSPACPKDTINITCDDCKRTFRSQKCFENHMKPYSHGNTITTVCQQITRCVNCFKVVKKNRNHFCGEIFCKICNTHVPPDHLCYMQPDQRRPKSEDIIFVFYDLETRQETIQQDGSLLHEPNLCVFKQCCDACLDTKWEICKKCGPRLQVVKGNSSVSSFLHHLLTIRKKFKTMVVMAHNGQAFDHQFCLNYILTKTDLTPELIMRGTKIISMVVENIKFLDSLNYFPMALSKLPKAFGLGDGLKKGYFPHLFNTVENQNYVGPLPAIEYYSSDSMKAEEREKFLMWYEDHKYDKFDMQKDIVDYCISDVEILTTACLKFRQQLIDTGNVCPFSEACTIASCCNKVYRRNFLKPKTIGIIPKGGYRWRDNQSRIAMQWLVWEEKQRGLSITHAAKQQEAIVQGVRVDGYIPETRQIFEFYGCYYHGCPNCFTCDRNNPLQEDPTNTLNNRYEATVARTSRLRKLGYDVIEMWECEFRRQLQQNRDLHSFTNNHPLVTLTPLHPREAFYGGRTGNTFEHYKCGTEEKIKYTDVCSLYPWVCKYGKFPIGHPKIYVGEECNSLEMDDMNGVIKCKILPPQDLYHPVLPCKMNDKLMFVLCRNCGEQMNKSQCNHNDEERALTGTWIVDEVRKAVEKGYKILSISEIWSYDVLQSDKTANVTGLFTDMMNKFIAVKQQASGWPSHCATDEARAKYIQEFLQREDVKLDFTEIVENPGLRSLAKLILNSFWGKLGQRENQPKTKIVREPSEFFGMLVNPSIFVNSALPINEDTLIVNWEQKEEAYDPLTTVNVVIASYVTAQARLKLYSYLEQLGERVLYYDTDSVIYVAKDGDYEIPTGQFLGDMTDELVEYGPNSYITEFVSGGPKNYAYKVFSTRDNDEKVICKVKGISLTYAAAKLINFDTIKNMVLSPSEPISIISSNIRRTKEHEVVTRQETKIYQTNSNKRKFLADHGSVPYGFKKLKTLL